MKPEIAIFYLYQTFDGGATSATVHLVRGMQLAGYRPHIYRIRERGEEFVRPFSSYEGLKYRNITEAEALKIAKRVPSIMTAACHSKHMPWAPEAIPKLIQRGMRVQTYDPNEFKAYDHLQHLDQDERVFCIRPTMKKFFPNAVHIYSPYVRHYSHMKATKNFELMRVTSSVSIARISFVKNVDIILDANRLVDNPDKKCVLRGAESRLYTKHRIVPNYPEFKQGGHGFPKGWGQAAFACREAMFAVDMTIFPDDGGGSQYSFMEAWDAGAINIIHNDWLSYKGEMKGMVNCIGIEKPHELAAFMNNGLVVEKRIKIIEAGYKALRDLHDPIAIAKEYYAELIR